MTRLTDRLGPVSLILALLAVLVGVRLAQDWMMPTLGAVAAAPAWPGLRRQATIATVYNRSTSVARMVLAAIAIGVGALKLLLCGVRAGRPVETSPEAAAART